MFIRQQYAEALTRHPPEGHFGLSYRPSLAPTFDDDADRHFDTGVVKPLGGMFSYDNAELLRLLLQLQQPKAILEIGVHNHRPSSSECFAQYKPEGCGTSGCGCPRSVTGAASVATTLAATCTLTWIGPYRNVLDCRTRHSKTRVGSRELPDDADMHSHA